MISLFLTPWIYCLICPKTVIAILKKDVHVGAFGFHSLFPLQRQRGAFLTLLLASVY